MESEFIVEIVGTWKVFGLPALLIVPFGLALITDWLYPKDKHTADI
jgi:hypothetical protein